MVEVNIALCVPFQFLIVDERMYILQNLLLSTITNKWDRKYNKTMISFVKNNHFEANDRSRDHLAN